MAAPPRTYVYVDAFNLYYGCLRGTPYKWLNVAELSRLLLPHNQILQIKYFTARVSARPSDPDQPVRQETYLRALRTIPGLSIHLGHFLAHRVRMPLVSPPTSAIRYAAVWKTEEKGSDVNIATHLVSDAYESRFDVGVLITNDSDLLEPVRLLRGRLSRRIGILNPQKTPRSSSRRRRRSSSKSGRGC